MSIFTYRKYTELATLAPVLILLERELKDCGCPDLYVTGECAFNLVTEKPIPRMVDIKAAMPILEFSQLCSRLNLTYTKRNKDIVITSDERRFIYTPLEGSDIYTDVKTRSFTMYSIYIDAVSGEAFDPCNALADINGSRLRCVGEPSEVFISSPIRIMQMITLCCEHNLSIDTKMEKAARENAHLLADVLVDLVRINLFSVLLCDTSKVYEGLDISGDNSPVLRGLFMLRDLDVFKYAVPELEYGRDMEQKRRFHKYDVEEHMLHTSAAAPPRLYMRLAGLFHDSGKPEAYRRNNGRNMHGHDKIGAEIAKQTLKRLHCKDDLINKVSRIIALHMYDIAGIAKETTLRKRFAQWGSTLTQDIIDMRSSDIQGSGCADRSTKSVTRFREIFDTMKQENVPFSIYELKITGRDISLLLDLHTGSEINEVKRALLRHCANSPRDNTYEKLAELAIRVKNGENID